MIDHTEICRINADGTTTYYWDNIEEAALRWQLGCGDIAACLSKLLLPLRPTRKWVGLTDEEKLDLAEGFYSTDIVRIEAVEAKLKEKNHD